MEQINLTEPILDEAQDSFKTVESRAATVFFSARRRGRSLGPEMAGSHRFLPSVQRRLHVDYENYETQRYLSSLERHELEGSQYAPLPARGPVRRYLPCSLAYAHDIARNDRLKQESKEKLTNYCKQAQERGVCCWHRIQSDSLSLAQLRHPFDCSRWSL